MREYPLLERRLLSPVDWTRHGQGARVRAGPLGPALGPHHIGIGSFKMQAARPVKVGYKSREEQKAFIFFGHLFPWVLGAEPTL